MEDMVRIDVKGGQQYLPFAKKKLRQMKELMAERGIEADNRRIRTQDADIFVGSISGQDIIRIRGLEGDTAIHPFLVYARHRDDAREIMEKELASRTVAFKIALNNKTIGPLEESKRKINIQVKDTGFNLVVQPGEGTQVAVMAHNFVYEDALDNFRYDAEGRPAGNHFWGFRETVFGEQRIFGADVAWLPSCKSDEKEHHKGFTDSYHARRSYTRDDKGKVGALDFRLDAKGLGTGFFHIGVYPNYRMLMSWHISYRVVPDGPWQRGALIGEDYERPSSAKAGEQDGYEWKYHVPVVMLSPDKAMVRSVKMTLLSAETPRKVPYHEEYTLAGSKGRIVFGRDGFITCTKTEALWQETLCVGNVEIARLTKRVTSSAVPFTDLGYWFGYGHWSDGVWHPGAGWYVIAMAAEVGKISIEAVTVFTGLPGQWHNGVHQEEGRQEVKGEGELRVMAFDNTGADKEFILFYKKELFDETNMTTSAITGRDKDGRPLHGAGKSMKGCEFRLACRTGEGNLTDVKIAGWMERYERDTIVLGGAYMPVNILRTWEGTELRHPSCQINNGIALYTYTLWEVTTQNGAAHYRFDRRVLGIVNLSYKGLPEGASKEFTLTDKEKRLEGFPHDHLAAVGLEVIRRTEQNKRQRI